MGAPLTLQMNRRDGHLAGLNIRLITPAPRTSRYGNRVTAVRWARFLRSLGHRVTIGQEYGGERCDMLIALHARRSARSIELFARTSPGRPLVLALTGTDLYRDIRTSPEAQRSLELATRIVDLQPKGREELPERLRYKVRTIFQSVAPTSAPVVKSESHFDVCVVGHLRSVKDPFRAAMAARLLPETSKVRVLHVGGAMSEAMESRARAEAARNPRYHWLGERPRWETRRIIKRSRLLVLSSKLEGGANVVSEALADSVPVLGSRIPGNTGMLGEDYPGYFAVGHTRELARLLRRAETDPAFLVQLTQWCARLAWLTDPAVERTAWQQLLHELFSERAAFASGARAGA